MTETDNRNERLGEPVGPDRADAGRERELVGAVTPSPASAPGQEGVPGWLVATAVGVLLIAILAMVWYVTGRQGPAETEMRPAATSAPAPEVAIPAVPQSSAPASPSTAQPSAPQDAEKIRAQETELQPLRAKVLKNPADPRVHLELGSALLRQGRSAEAISAYRDAQRLEPKSVDPLVALGNAYAFQGRFDDARKAYRQALEILPSEAGIYYNLGAVAIEEGKIDEGLAAYRKAIELRPGFAAAHNNLGAVLESQVKWEEAEAQYREALRLDPNNAGIRSNLKRVTGFMKKAASSSPAAP